MTLKDRTQKTVDEIRARIDSGRYSPGIPYNMRRLSSDLNVPYSTIRCAVDYLIRKGDVFKSNTYMTEIVPMDKDILSTWSADGLPHYKSCTPPRVEIDDIGEAFTTADVADILKVSKPTIYYWIRTRKLPARKLGKAGYRILRRDFQDFVDKHRCTQD